MDRYDYASRARLALRGPDRVRFLHGMVTCDVEKLGEGGGSRAAMLSVKGRLLAELTVYARPDELLLSMEGELGGKVREVLEKHLIMDDVEVVDRSTELGELGLYGEDAFATVAGALSLDVARLRALHPYQHLDVGDLIVARDPQLGGAGLRLLGPPARLAELGRDARPLSEAEREVRRVEAGTARYGVDLDEERLIVEANLEDAISFDKGCYLGQEVVVRATSRGRVNRRLMGLVVSGEGPVPPRTKLAAPTQAEAGLTTSSVVSTKLGGPIALGYVHRNAFEAGATMSLEGGDRRAIAVELPFSAERVAEARAKLA